METIELLTKLKQSDKTHHDIVKRLKKLTNDEIRQMVPDVENRFNARMKLCEWVKSECPELILMPDEHVPYYQILYAIDEILDELI